MTGLLSTTPVPTPAGSTPARELRAGDVVYDEAGEPVRVSSVELSRGEAWSVRLEAHQQASELVLGAGQRLPLLPQRLSHRRTGPLFPEGWPRLAQPTEPAGVRDRWRVAENRRDARWHLPVGAPLLAPVAELPADPYALGLAHANSLRDGTVRCWARALPWFLAHLGQYGAREVSTRGYWSRLELPGLDALTIGREYALASPDQRLALLDGLSDACRTSELGAAATSWGSALTRVLDLESALASERAIRSLGHSSARRERPTLPDNPRWLGQPLHDLRWVPRMRAGRLPRLRARRGLGEASRPGAGAWTPTGATQLGERELATVRLAGRPGGLMLVGDQLVPAYTGGAA